MPFRSFFRAITILATLTTLPAIAIAQSESPLPNWADPIREPVAKEASPVMNFIPLKIPHPSFRLVPEYFPAQAVILGWSGFPNMLKSIAKIAANEGGVQIWAVRGPFSLSSVSDELYESIDCALNSVWMRDYGPLGVLDGGRLGIVDSVYRHHAYRRDDDRIPLCLAQEKGVEIFGMDLILDGGNLMVDSVGNLFMTKRTYSWNKDKSKEEVDELIKQYFNVHTIHALDYAGYPGWPADGTGHIDMFVKLLNDSTVLISKANKRPYKSAVQKAVEYFSKLKAPDGGAYKIIRINGISREGTWYSYTNSLIVNDVVIIPSYSALGEENEQAVRTYQSGLPNVLVKKVNSDRAISAGGAIHCVTQLVPKND